MRVAVTKACVDNAVFVSHPITICILMPPDTGNIIGQYAATVIQGHRANGNIQTTDEALDRLHLVRFIEARHHCQPIAGGMITDLFEFAARLVDIPFGGVRILDRTTHPKPTLSVEVKVHRLAYVRLSDHQFNDEPFMDLKLLLLLLGTQCIGRRNSSRLKRTQTE